MAGFDHVVLLWITFIADVALCLTVRCLSSRPRVMFGYCKKINITHPPNDNFSMRRAADKR